MPTFKEVTGFDALSKELKTLASSKSTPIFVLFCGSKDSSGNSWCPDCVTAEPVVHASAKKILADTDAVFVHCYVGERNFWKDQKNPFRTTEGFKLTGVPTLMQWGKPNKLVEEQCMKAELVKMLFSDGIDD